MSKHNIVAGVFLCLFLGAIIGLNVYSFLPNTNWFQFGVSIVGASFTFGVNRGGLYDGNGNIEWNSDSQTRNTLYISFAFVIASFVLSCIMLLITMIALFKRVHKKGRKVLFVMSLFVFVFNVLATLIFLRLNKAICEDFSNGLSLPSSIGKEIVGTDICSKFKGSDSLVIGSVNWGPTIGWYCSVAAAALSFISIFLASTILHTKRFGYHVIH